MFAMPTDKQFPVYSDDGLVGTLFAPARFLDDSPEKRVRLENGREVKVPASALEPRSDGSFYLKKPVDLEMGSNGAQTTAPVEPTEPSSVVQPSPESTVTSVAEGFGIPAGQPLLREDCEITRVNVRRLVDKPAETRQEGDTLILPLMEEVWVVEKRLLLREELHIKRKTDKTYDPNAKPLRKEDLEATPRD
jgi:hypothetical protein